MFDEFPQIITENLILRRMEISDAEAVFQFFADSEVVKYHDVEAFESVEQAKLLINRLNTRFNNNQGIRWGIARKTNNIIIGTCGYNQWNKERARAEIGYELAKQHWRKGIMTEALQAIIKFGFERIELKKIVARVMVENTASMKLLEKLGFVDAGISKKRGFWKGQFHDLRMFMLKDDWLSSKIKF